jgi:catechol 2,3-dioxygenase-like lactoylglutathione lyase family enzyme
VPPADFTHLALIVADLDASLAFYRRYTELRVADERHESGGGRVAWLTDEIRRFALILVCPGRLSLRNRLALAIARRLPPANHLGFEFGSREQVEELCTLAAREDVLRREPRDHGPPVGFYGMLTDPDGNSVELSFGQDTRKVFERSAP